MKRKVKFQEGGAVEGPARRPARESARNRQLREMMEKTGREGKRVRGAERARQRQTAARSERSAAAAERAAAQREVAEFNQRPEVQEQNRRTSAGPDRIPQSPRPSAVRPMTNLPPQAIPEPPRPSTVGMMRGAAAPAARAGSRLIPGVGALAGMMPTSLEAGARFEREGLAQAREEQRMGDRAAMEQGMGETGSRMPTPRPAPMRRPAAPAPREMSAERLNELMMGAEPMNAEENVAVRRMRGRQQELEDRGTAFRKGGMVKPEAAPKKMMKGGAVAKPKAGAKAKAKPMPAFKKGGMIKKGKK
jgi:hypothetical protein